jgi:hypothetical protein
MDIYKIEMEDEKQTEFRDLMAHSHHMYGSVILT